MSVHTSTRGGGGVPLPRCRWGREIPPSQVQSRQGGYPWPLHLDLGRGYPTPSHLGLGRGHPHPLPPDLERGYPTVQHWMGTPLSGDSSIASTCHAAGGMPLAFTQEDFFVFSSLTHINLSYTGCHAPGFLESILKLSEMSNELTSTGPFNLVVVYCISHLLYGYIVVHARIPIPTNWT